jgi:2-iminobutanoate/2-iminopropanoate deaminase
MSNRAISSPAAPKAIGPYSQAILANNTLYVSGQLPIDAATGAFAPGGIKEQCHQSLKNVGHILNEAGFSYRDVVKATVYLSDMGNFAAMNEVYAEYFTEPYQVAALPKAALVEIDVIAVK